MAHRLGYVQVEEAVRIYSYGAAPLSSGGAPIGVGRWEVDEDAVGELWLGCRAAIDGECRFAGPLGLEDVNVYDLIQNVIAPATAVHGCVARIVTRWASTLRGQSSRLCAADTHAHYWASTLM